MGEEKIQAAIDCDWGGPWAILGHALYDVIGAYGGVALGHGTEDFTALAGQFAAAPFAGALGPGDEIGGAMGVVVVGVEEGHICYNITYLRELLVPRLDRVIIEEPP